jgi:hypothetical protein
VNARRRAAAVLAAFSLAAMACGGSLDAGRDRSHGLLPVDERNPVIIDNDWWKDNWLGEYAMLLANNGGPPLAGIIISNTAYWPDVSANASGWTNLVTAARSSGLENIPDVTVSVGAALARPADGRIDSTTPNRSAGARLIVDVSRQLSLPWRPVVVLGGAPLTNLADAYLIDHSVVDRVVVVAALGEYAAPKGTMNGPNGDLDPWADWIVAQRFRYVQVSAYYGQTGDVTAAQVPDLPHNALGTWMADKLPDLFTIPNASDQIALLSVGLPAFAVAVQRASPDTSVPFDPMQGPPLVPDPNGNAWIVTQIAAPLAAARLWQVLLDPHTFGS